MPNTGGHRGSSINLSGATIAGHNLNIGGGNSIEAGSADKSEAEQTGSPLLDPLTFVSYSRTDADPVFALVEMLAAAGIAAWVDGSHLRAGDEWRSQIKAAIQRATSLVAVFSDASEERSWSEQRSEIVIARDIRARRPLPIVPVRLSNCDIPPIPIGPGDELLSDLHFVNLFPDLRTNIGSVIAALQR